MFLRKTRVEYESVNHSAGVLPEPDSYYDNLTARQNLRIYAKLYYIDEKIREKRIVDLLELVGLSRAID
ncbi:P-loop NTPase family protein [Candidatus Methanoperedens nitratireducens]|uniref:Uncharacterized protein n=1 Tax=Candidatus Methanoperedens nitratireducens TaxID=1392998 RepID=A0A284VIM9_9EURY|nr:hypothetical protein [Candidatus Methanoperedens nitroreducens]SNQ59122.1 hypothetical protein MNV_1070012 [Candidatus Methanoperedens nitroreducens]